MLCEVEMLEKRPFWSAEVHLMFMKGHFLDQ